MDPRSTSVASECARQAAARWPRVYVPLEGFEGFLRGKLGDDADQSALDALRTDELYLAYACLLGDREALALLEEHYLAQVPRALGRLRLTPDERDEVTQRVRHRLLVGTERGPARLETYSGRGDLRSWIFTAAIRVGQNYLADQRPTISAEPELHEHPGLSSDLQLAYLRREYGDQFRTAFEHAVTQLTREERNLLRFHFVDGMTSDALAAVFGIHRSTAARRVASARDKLATLARRAMMANMGVGRADLGSIMRLIASQLDVSVARYLASRSREETP